MRIHLLFIMMMIFILGAPYMKRMRVKIIA